MRPSRELFFFGGPGYFEYFKNLPNFTIAFEDRSPLDDFS